MSEIIHCTHGEKIIETAVSILRNGDCLGVPTETVYGLAGDATNGKAVAKIFALKNRPSFNPLICHVSGIEMAEEYGVLNSTAKALIAAFWPGPLTLVVKKQADCDIHDLASAGLDSIGLRCPFGIIQNIIHSFGKPLAAPSANKSGKISPTTAEHVLDEFETEDLKIIDGGPSKVGLESSIVKIENKKLTLLRPGSITVEEIQNAAQSEVEIVKTNASIEAPGMMQSHYAPNAKVLLNCDQSAPDAAWLGFGEKMESNSQNKLNLSRSGDLVEAASNLYAHLKKLDALGLEKICVMPIPMKGLGIAINDRLSRAAAPRGNADG